MPWPLKSASNAAASRAKCRATVSTSTSHFEAGSMKAGTVRPRARSTRASWLAFTSNPTRSWRARRFSSAREDTAADAFATAVAANSSTAA